MARKTKQTYITLDDIAEYFSNGADALNVNLDVAQMKDSDFVRAYTEAKLANVSKDIKENKCQNS